MDQTVLQLQNRILPTRRGYFLGAEKEDHLIFREGQRNLSFHCHYKGDLVYNLIDLNKNLPTGKKFKKLFHNSLEQKKTYSYMENEYSKI